MRICTDRTIQRTRWLCLPAAASCILLLGISQHAAGKYDDTVFLTNGDRLTGDVKELDRTMLRYKTERLSTIHIPWDDVQSLETATILRIELKSGRRMIGAFGGADGAERLVIRTPLGDQIHERDNIVAFVPLKLQQAWIERVEGAIKFGLSGTKGSNTLQWNVGLDALYRSEHWELSSRWDSIITDKSDNTSSERISFTTSYRRLMADRWFWNLILGYDKNDELGIDNRWSTGAGAGRYFIRNNAFELVLQSGLLASREFRTDATNNQLEAYAGASFAWFRNQFPETDIRTEVLILPSLTDSGRVRSNWDISIAREFIEDLALDLSVYYTTDNRSPDDAQSTDWGVVTSIQYSF